MSTYRQTHIDRQAEHVRRRDSPSAERRRASRFFHREVDRLVSSQVLPDGVVVDAGCATGSTLRACRPRVGVGIDLSDAAIEVARASRPDGHWLAGAVEEVELPVAEAPDYVILSFLLDEVYDVAETLGRVRDWCAPTTRVVVTSYNRAWRPALRLAELLGLKSRTPGENYIPWIEVENLLTLAGFEVTKRIDGILFPVYVPLLSRLVNRWLAPLPILRSLALTRVTVARPRRVPATPIESVSVVVAARNEAGNIASLLDRLPRLAQQQQVILVEGGSTDDTWETIRACVAGREPDDGMAYVCLQQPGTGKGDAVRAGFEAADGEVLIILDADLSVPPEELTRFIDALAADACEFANGSRLVYPMDDRAMRFLNVVGNRIFGILFTFLLGQPVRDTLCGTKALRAQAYRRLAAQRGYLGDFDPFGDFDLLFGASRLGLRVRDVPVHYKERTYGSTNISRFRHGMLLLRMSRVAALRLKFVG